MRMVRPFKTPARTHATASGFWHWKPSRRLREEGGFRTEALGADVREAFRLARGLNQRADDWLASAGPARPKKARANSLAAEARATLTFSELANRWRQSPNWQQLRGSTRETYASCLKILEAEFGHDRANRINRARVLAWADPLRLKSPQGLRHYAAVARALFEWSKPRELVSFGENPFEKMDLPAGRRAVRIREADMLALVAIADRDDILIPGNSAGQPVKARSDLGTCMLCAFYLIQRISDVLRLTSENFAGGGFALVQSKTGKAIEISRAPERVLARLKAHPPSHAETAPATRPNRPATLFRGANTLKDPDAEAGRAFARLKRRAALVDPALAMRIAAVQLRDMRRSGFVHYAEGQRDAAGRIIRQPVPVHLICSISGHTIDEGMAILEVYLPKTREQADMAVSMMMGAV